MSDTSERTPLLAGSTTRPENIDSRSSVHSYTKPESLSGVTQGSTITFHHLYYNVQVKNPKRRCGMVDKEILHDISGIFRPGMSAIMGPTGGGKSSLLDVLAGRKDPAGLKGDVIVDGKKQPENFKCMSGYVVEDDVVMGSLTVRENLAMSANLRLPSSISTADKKKRVEDTLIELGLMHCANTKIGTNFIRGVSHGERKRTNIGMELIISPSVLFLDEPTTGLDANTAHSIMLHLHGLSRKGRTIIFSIHQPRFSIYRLFDNLLLLGRGKTIYHGPCKKALDYLGSRGYVCEPYNNPPDFFLDVISGTVEPQRAKTESSESTEGTKDAPTEDRQWSPLAGGNRLVDAEGQFDHMIIGGDTALDEAAIKVDMMTDSLSKLYRESEHYSTVMKEIDPIYQLYDPDVKPDVQPDYATSWITQSYYLCVRTSLNIWRNPMATYAQFIVTALMAAITGAIYFQLDHSYPNGIQNRVGVFFFLTMNMAFANMNALELFINERAMFIHENMSGYYRTSAYLFAKYLCDIVPMRTLPLVIFAVISYFMIGLEVEPDRFFIFFLTLWLTAMASTAICSALSATVGIFAVANLCLALVLVFMMIFGGFLVNLNDVVPWLGWLQYVSLFRFCLNALSINEFKDMELCAAPVGNHTQCFPNAGNSYLENQGIPFETSWDLWVNHVGLAAIALVCLAITYIQLRRIKKYK